MTGPGETGATSQDSTTRAATGVHHGTAAQRCVGGARQPARPRAESRAASGIPHSVRDRPRAQPHAVRLPDARRHRLDLRRRARRAARRRCSAWRCSTCSAWRSCTARSAWSPRSPAGSSAACSRARSCRSGSACCLLALALSMFGLYELQLAGRTARRGSAAPPRPAPPGSSLSGLLVGVFAAPVHRAAGGRTARGGRAPRATRGSASPRSSRWRWGSALRT